MQLLGQGHLLRVNHSRGRASRDAARQANDFPIFYPDIKTSRVARSHHNTVLDDCVEKDAHVVVNVYSSAGVHYMKDPRLATAIKQS